MRTLDVSSGSMPRRSRRRLRFPPPPRMPWILTVVLRRPLLSGLILYITWLGFWAIYAWMGFADHRADLALLP